MDSEANEDVSMNRAPKASAQYARESQLAAEPKMVGPDADITSTPVKRTEMMSELPKQGKDVDPWKPGEAKHIK